MADFDWGGFANNATTVLSAAATRALQPPNSIPAPQPGTGVAPTGAPQGGGATGDLIAGSDTKMYLMIGGGILLLIGAIVLLRK